MKKKRALKIVGWVLVGLVALIFVMSGLMKLALNETALEEAKAVGLESNVYQILGVIELLAVVLLLIPRTGIIGSLLLIAYMGGAIAALLIMKQPVIPGVIIETIIWVASAIRFPELRDRLFSSSKKNEVGKFDCPNK